MTCSPSVTVVIPTFNEEVHLRDTLESVRDQSYGRIVEVLVADGRSTDSTRDIAREFDFVRVIDNPRRIQAAGLNEALQAAQGEIVVRADGHCVLDVDYVEVCVEALEETGAAIVGGAMRPAVSPAGHRGIARAMASPIGAGPARFHVGGPSGWVDTVYLGAYRLADALAVGGYAEDVGVNEDAEFAIRLGARGGVWFDPRISSTYIPRAQLSGVVRQFYRYGRSRAATVRRHPHSLKPRQVVAPLLVLGIVSPWRRQVIGVYGSLVVLSAARRMSEGVDTAVGGAVVMPAMHFSWGLGFLIGLVAGAGGGAMRDRVGQNLESEERT